MGRKVKPSTNIAIRALRKEMAVACRPFRINSLQKEACGMR
jgi:hypothetical protein